MESDVGVVSAFFEVIRKNLLIILIVLSVIAGIILGFSLRGEWSSDDHLKMFYLEFPSRLLMNMLKIVMLPLIMSSIITGLASVDMQASSRLGCATLVYFMSTTMMAVIEGMVLVLMIHPGHPEVRGKSSSAPAIGSLDVGLGDSILDIISQCIPENLITACFETTVTKYGNVSSAPMFNKTSNTTYTKDILKPKLVTVRGMNVLGLIMFSIVFGYIINSLGSEGYTLKEFFRSAQMSMMTFITVIIWYTPIGILFSVAANFVSTEDLSQAMASLVGYITVLMLTLVLHGFVVLPLFYFIFTRKSPLRLAFNQSKALFTAWGTASSAATLPVTMDCLINKNKIHIDVVNFVAPVGATINMDGMAIYEVIVCIFIAQINGIELGVVDLFVIGMMSITGAVGAAGIPQAGLVILIIALTAVGLPSEDIYLILPIDWLVDRFLTSMNVWGDAVVAGIIDHNFRHLLPESTSKSYLVFPKDPSTQNDSSVGSFSKERDQAILVQVEPISPPVSSQQ